MPISRLPSSTYRIQLNQNFRFADTLNILDYLHELGVSDLYLSPILASRKGSTHGYDLIDPSRINPDLGTEEEFTALQTELQNRGMGLLLDIVPNHMAANAENPWWMDVLENGAQSAFAAFFDIEWHPHARSLEGRILLPVLGRPFGEALDSGEIKLIYNDGRFFIQYFDSLFPVSPRAYHSILNLHAGRLQDSLGEDSPAYHEYSGILSSGLDLSRADRRVAMAAPEQRLRFESARDRLRALINSSPEVAKQVEENVAEINGKEGDPASFGLLQRLLAEQNYKLAFWQNLNESINYRRFFTIADLVGVRVEDPLVFEASHGYILRLMSRNPEAGLRIDHIDGLRDPAAYLNRLQERLAANENRSGKQSYLLVEKILARGEQLPSDWPVSGTTGYDYLNEANGIFVDPQGARCIEEIYSEFIGRKQEFSDVLYQKKKLVMNTLLGVEMRTLGRQLAELAAQDRYARELNRGQLIDALIEVTACMPIYRTYIRNMEIPPEATKYIEQSVAAARIRAPHLNSDAFDFVREVLLLENPPHVLPDQRETRLVFVMRWQQFTGPIVAKGFEDTALYVFHPLLSMNEVGGNPRPTEAESLAGFYRFLEQRRQSWPGTLDATSTHDTKRSEDVRARINVLSEIPEEWKTHLDLWAHLNGRFKEQIDGQAAPDRNEEYFLYQTLIGVWPLDQGNCRNLLERIQAHLVKATREAMVHTRWTRPNQAHEEALQNFAARILSPENGEFLSDFRALQKKIAYYGMINGLSQVLLKIASPGVADFYQGSELWDLRLVDPDNRGVVDFSKRASALSEIAKANTNELAQLGEIVENWHDGRIKLYLIWKALRFRRDHADLFHEGEFVPIDSAGCRARNIVAFLRRTLNSSALIVVPRWLAKLPGEPGQAQDWCDTRVVLTAESPKIWTNILSQRETHADSREDESCFMLNELLSDFPVAFLEASEPSPS
ncbi:MAG: malto-oligosyltrehalose synthase [Candidatus Sulfotelmatobacter sp.]